MPLRDTAPTGAPCWVDLFTSDPDASTAFYSELFGWKAESAGEEYGGYISFMKDETPVAGAMRNDGQTGTPDVWLIYLATDDADATVEAAAANGGGVLFPTMDVTDIGRMAMVSDAGQAAIGMWQAGEFFGFTVVGEANTPAWFELLTRDYDASVDFYQKVFGWDTHVAGDTPEFRYTTLGQGDGQLAGIMDASVFLPEGVPAHWSVYFGVADTDATLTKAVELGATIVQPAEDTPYGRIAQATDPTGARFKLVTIP